MDTIRITFPVTASLATRNEMFRQARLRFAVPPAVLLLRDGYAPLPLNEAGNEDVMFAEAVQLTGTLTSGVPNVLLS